MRAYENIESKNLGFLLIFARMLAYTGGVLFVLSCLYIVIMSFDSGFRAVQIGFAYIPMSVGIVFMSGVLAALVSFEENYRLRTEHQINQK